MSDITKTKTHTGTYEYGNFVLNGKVRNVYTSSVPFGDTITYARGPKFGSDGLNWKGCVHTTTNTPSGSLISWDAKQGSDAYSGYRSPSPESLSLPQPVNLLNDCIRQFKDQIDLNCSDGVLLYSGILQAVPLVGGALNFVRVFNNAAKSLSRSFKQRPFTTVVKSLIQGDFINRFVVKPTIDDANKFLDAHNYVVRTIETAYRRQMGLDTVYSMTASSGNKSIASLGLNLNGIVHFDYTRTDFVGTRAKLNVLADVSYNTSSIDPIKLWMARCGITRPLDSVWDLIPFSFVVDYFVKAGDFISGLSDKMSSQDGLKGKVQSIKAAWYMLDVCNEREFKTTSARSISSITDLHTTLGSGMVASRRFSRTALDILPALYNWRESNELFDVNLSSTRKRTLAQLIIQAKL